MLVRSSWRGHRGVSTKTKECHGRAFRSLFSPTERFGVVAIIISSYCTGNLSQADHILQQTIAFGCTSVTRIRIIVS
jgi:hypothetical protein